MVDQVHEFLNQVRQLLNTTEDIHAEDLSTEDEEEEEEEEDDDDENEPGHCTDIGDIVFNLKTTSGNQQSKHTLDSRLYQQILKSQDCQLVDVYNSNALYICESKDMKTKIMAHMKRTNAYSFIEKLCQTNSTCVRQHLDTIVERVTTLLNDLVTSHSINDSQFRQMNVDRSTVRMDYLFFLPDLRQKHVSFQPIMVCHLGPTIEIARYIYRLLQPIYDQVALSTTFFKETDAVHAVEQYANKDLLLPTTLFASLHINDLCSILSHEEILQSLEHFLNKYYKFDQSIQTITIDTILKLINLILQNQFFVFENNVYRQIKGGATESPLTILLMNIYLFYWQDELVQIMINKNEIFGRCFDKIFLTWNGTKNELRSLLDETNINKNKQTSSSSIQITTSIGKKINYIDAQIGHINGSLLTKINHDTDTEPRSLPYVSNHPRLSYSTLIRASLIRAVLCCSNSVDFHTERFDIQETFHSNGYTYEYINNHVEQFFREFKSLKLKSYIVHQSRYETLRHRVYKYDQEQINMTIQQRKDEQHKEVWYIPISLKGKALTDFQENLKRIWQDCFGNDIRAKNINIEVINQPKYPSNTK
ncbi:unnamed protein product [Adineta steineri]|uniref:Helix-turn-helix domain-containing protein n=1 Tax=Adineta steineri TaxID=433720 RepID=A0A818LYZ4_9BILA|nr:unnamed protein product [Adineta steineri]CAF3586486.1 unnamed protein product [Adineta steineri]